MSTCGWGGWVDMAGENITNITKLEYAPSSSVVMVLINHVLWGKQHSVEFYFSLIYRRMKMHLIGKALDSVGNIIFLRQGNISSLWFGCLIDSIGVSLGLLD